MNSKTRSRRRSRTVVALVLAVLAAVGVRLSAQQSAAPVPSSNINMVSGTTFPDGDPYLQRQNEPNLAVSTRNPLHLLGGSNDYRTVDLPGPFDPMRGFKMNADAWVGLFKSVDGGQTWTSTLLPGFPQDASPEGLVSPIKGREGSTDPIMRSGTNGLFYYAGVAFDRGGNRPSSIFVARYMDLNNREAGDPFGYVDTRLVDSDAGTRFLDKVTLATDIPRGTATCTIASRQSGDKPGDPPIEHVRTMPAGNVYVAYVAFTGSEATEQSVVMISRSTDCGATWSAPLALSTGSRLVQNPQIAISPVDGAVHVSWRRFKYLTQDDAVMVVKSVNFGATYSKPLRVAGLRPFDQGTTSTSFRSNGFQTMAVDAGGRVYLAWPDRGYAATRSDPVIGDSRIVIATSTTGATWSVPRAIQPTGVGHQLMPAMTFHGGKLRILYYDLREDVSQLFGPFIDELPILTGPTPRIRHTMDVFIAQAAPGGTPTFTTARVSEYASGFLPGSTVEQRLQFNPPNLPMFRQGAVPFMGDYIDLAPAPPFVLNDNGTWSYNTGANGSTVSHAVWTDNRDVRPPANGNWADYTPVTSPAVGTQSRFDPTQQVPSCEPGQVGMRNQNIYTARVTDGLFVSAPGNTKPFTGFQRAFVVVAENASALPRTYRLQIENQPLGGEASFLQFGAPLLTLDVATPALSSVARSVFVTAQDQTARIRLSVTEITGVGGAVVTNGLTGTVVLNPDPQNPVLQNPVLQNPVLQNPVLQNISQGESYNPGISAALVGVPNLQNPSLQNPTLQNPNLQNPSIQNPHLQNPTLQNPTLQNPVLQNDAVANPSIVNADLSNPSLQNPTLQNPSLQNPTLQNPNLQNAGISDTNWVVTNEGNTTASYTVNLLLNSPVPAGFTTQLLIHKTFTTPAADGCALKEQPHTILLANIPNPQFVTDPTNPNLQNPHLQNPSLQNPTLALAPGESATVTLRVIDPNIFDGVAYDASAAVTPAAVAQSVNTVDVAAGDTTPSVALPLTITTAEIPPTTPGAPINRTIGLVAAIGTVSCSVVPGLGTLPPGVTLSPNGTLSGTPTTPGNYGFTVECVDSGPPERRDRQTLTIQVNPASPVGYDALWNGVDSNWYNPANWSPRGVPPATSRVYLSAATAVIPRLAADVTVRDLFLEPGATLDTNGFTLTVTNNADAGRTIIGPGQTVLTGNGSTAAGVFSNLVIAGRITLSAPLTTTGTLTLAPGARLELNGQPLIVGGQLITDVTEDALPLIVGAAENLFIVTGVNVNGLVLHGAPLTINAGALTRFDNVSFSGYAPEAIQLTVNNPGLITHFPMIGLTFSNQPISGQYIRANDTLLTGPQLILDVMGAVPADGSAFTLTTGGAVVNWLGNPGEANLAVTQSVAPVPAAAGTRLNYTITVTNGGPSAAASVVLNPGLPIGATGVISSTSQGSCVLGSGGLSCALGAIPAGGSVQTTVSFLTAFTGTLNTTAVVSSSTPDTVIANNSHTVGAVIVPTGQGVDLRLTKTDSADPVGVNAPFTYTLTVTNVGTTEATNVVVTDNVPSGITISYATSASGMCSAISSQVLCSFASILPGQTVTMTFNATGTTVGAWTNQASVTSAQIELTPADNVVSETTMVLAASAACSTAMFSGPSRLAAPSGVLDVLPGDLNGDGALDLVALAYSLNSVAVYLGDGIGGFGTPILYPAGDRPIEGELVDLNLDGRLDLALEGQNDAFVLMGNGSGGFAAPVQYTFPGVVKDVRSGDFNADGRPDLVVAVFDTSSLYIMTGLTAGGFSAPVAIPLPGRPHRVAVDDLNHDGRADLAVAYFWSNVQGAAPSDDFVSVLLANGTGGFSAPATIPLQAAHFSRVFSLGDFNGDTHRDLAAVEITASGGGRGGRLFLLSGDGAGNFSVQQLVNVPGDAINFSVTSGDVNGDGHLDLVASTGDVGQMLVWLGNGAGAFAAPSSFVAPFGYDVRLADFNGDGRPDVVIGMSTGVSIFLNGCGQPAGDLVLSAFDSPDPVAEGAALGFSSTVMNAGGTLAANVTLTQTLSSGLGSAVSATSSQGTCTIAGRLVTCNLGSLAPNASADVQVTFTPSAAGSLTSVIGVGSERPDSSPADNIVTLTTTVTAASRQLVVTNTNNAGAGSLRQAILDSNADSGDRDTIVFNIPGVGVHTIVPLTALPVISQPVVIDGTEPPDSTPLVELNGNGLAGPGLTITGGNSIVRGLVINRFGGPGILLQTNGGNVIAGNYIGVDALATTSRPNGGHGVHIDGTPGNTLGGVEPAARNVISGNALSGVAITGAAAMGNLVASNFIGTNGSGMSAISNNAHGVLIENSSANTVGTPDAGNVISGNVQNGIAILGASSSANQIYANRIGVNALSSAGLGNLQDGIRIEGAASTIIGGVGLARNIIGGNAQNGIGIYSSTAGDAAPGTQIVGNTIGFRSPPNTIGNGLSGVHLGFASNTVIGGDTQDGTNLISHNGRNGVTMLFGTGNGINGTNSIVNNSILAIDLGNNGVTANDAGDGDTGSNNLQNFPVLTATAAGVQGTLNSLANSTYTIQFFANQACDASGNGEGETFLGAVNVNAGADGNAAIPLFAATAGQIVTATATSSGGDTSEFSQCVTVPATAPTADLTLTMTDSADPVALGTPFNYVLTARNLGPQPAVGVQITDTLPAGLTATVASASQGTCTIGTSSVTCNIGTLGVNATAAVTITATSSVSGTLTNSASIISELQDPISGNNSDSEQTTIVLASCSAVTFTGPRPFAGSAGEMAMVRLVDMNHDGHLDAVGTHETDPGGVDVFLNDGAGGFAAPRFTSVGSPWIHSVADFNGDTHPDVITASESNVPVHSISLRLLTNDGTGTLTLVPGFSLPFEGTLTAVDIDRDGDQDLAIVMGDELVLRRNDGQANFAAAETIIAGLGGWPAFGDFNGDNRTDVVVGIGTPGVAVALANASGGFLAPVVHAVPGGAHGVADPADLNGDGRLDLFTIAGDANGPAPGASVLFGDGAGGFGGAVQATSDFVYLPTLADVNGDGRPDLVGISTVSSFGVWLGNGGGTFAAPVHFANAVYYGPAVGDLNGDGRPDLVTGDINGTLNVFFNNCGAAPANLSVVVAESADPVNEGDELTYTVTVTNLTGTAATGVRLTGVLGQLIADDPTVPNVTVLGATSSVGGTLTTTGATHVWTVPTLAANSAATFTFRFRPLAGGALEFGAGVTSDGAETDPADNSARETTIVNATGSTLTVTTTADSGPGSLRRAIEISNADSGDRDTIAFNIPGGGVPTITLQSGLDLIDQPVVIDGTSQPTTHLVELNGNGLTATGLVISGGNSIVRGMVITRFGFDAISLEGGGGNVVEGNLIGTDPTGNVARPNGSGGIRVFSANNRIGGLTAAARNVISGNQQTGVTLQNATATGNVVQGNYIGLNAAGTTALPNGGGVGGIQIFNGARGNTLGGAVAGAGNVVSGNTGNGISVNGAAANDNVVQGNFIGTDPTGSARIANGQIGLDIISAQRTIVGGLGVARNVISGNNTGIQIRTNASGTLVQNNYIGVNAAGTAAISNGIGVSINNTASGNTIGGATAGLGNVISGNTTAGVNLANGSNANTIQGNLIGLDAGGTLDLGNTADGININGVAGTVVGGVTPAARNVISGNNSVGIRISGTSATGNRILGNYIGVNAAGTAAVGNSGGGISVLTQANGNTIGGAQAGEGNVISGNTTRGIFVQNAANGNTIQGNLIGLNAAGSQALANTADGIGLDNVSGTIIGGTAAGAGNVISGNASYGINNAAGSTGTVVLGNRIGTNAAGSNPVPNGISGLFVDGNGMTIGGTAAGAANVIAHNALNGVNVAGGTGHAIVGNSIFSNSALGINLGPAGVTANDAGDGDVGANNHQNFPVLAAAAGGVQGTFNSTPNGTFTIHYYGNTACDPTLNGEGETFLGSVSVTTDANGNATLPLFAAAGGLIVTATATSATNDTSEFSACAALPLGPATFTVTNTNDSGAGSLRQAILDANARANTTDTIAFNIPGTAPFTIALVSALPPVNDAVVLDGRSQPGFSGTPIIELNGAGAGPGTTGLRINAGSVVRGLVINRFSADGIALVNASVGGNVIVGNYIGTNAAGTAAFPNLDSGISVNSPGNQIGGPDAGDANVIAGNGVGVQMHSGATASVIRGNRIGTNAAGSAAIPNGAGINVSSSHGNTIGDVAAGAGNLISGNSGNGIWINDSNDNVVQGNLIGTNAGGAGALPNGFGMFVMGARNIISSNVISGNTSTGISVGAGATATALQGNVIGADATGTNAVPNGGHGVFLDGSGTTVGGAVAEGGNIIANSGLAGVRVNSGAGHSLLRNSIFGNGQLGIDVGPGGTTANDTGDADTGANTLQNFPVLSAAAGGVQGTLNSTPDTTYTIQFFGNAACDSSGHGEGQTFLGASSVHTDANGDATLPFFAVSPVQVVTATATSASGDTSEFSACVTSRPPNGQPIANAGSDQTDYVGRLVTLAGSGSDPDDDDLTYAWSFTSRPAGSEATLSNAAMPSATFTPDVPGAYTVQLLVDDGTDSSVPDSVSITVLSNEIAMSLVGAQVVGVTRQAPIRVTLPFVAPAGGTTVTLTSAAPGLLSVVAPGTASIPAGQTVGQIMVRGEGSGTAVLRANATGYGQGSLSVVVTHNLISTPSTLNVAFGGSTALPINIGPDAAPAGGLTLNVASSDADIEVLTPQVTVPAGALSANATVRGVRVGTANVTVSNPNYAPSTTVVTSRAELNIVQTSASFNQGLPAPAITVRLESNGTQIAAQPELRVTLTSANTNCVSVPSSVTIPAGLVSTSFTPAYGGTATLPCTATVTASATDVTPDTVSVTVNRPAEIVGGATVTVGAGLMENAFASVSAAQHGGLDVTITAGTEAQPGPVRLSRTATEVGTRSITVHLNNGQTSISYYVHALENTTGSSTVTLTAEAVTADSHTVEVVQPAVEILNLTASMNTLSGADSDVYVQTGITHPSYNNAQLYQVQNVRTGSPGLEVTLTNSTSTVARLRSDEPAATAGQTGQVVRKTIPAGVYYTQAIATGTTYGLAFEPLGTGTTTVTVTAPGAVTMTSTGVRQVQVTSPVINAGGTLMVGAGLMDSAFASLSAAQHGGVDVTISAATGPVRVSRTATEVGTQSITVHVNNGQTSIPYYVHGLESTTGSSTITLSAERFTSASHTVDVVQPAVEILNLTASMNTLSGADTDVYVQVGITHPSYNNAQLWQVQAVRAGGAGFEVTLTNSTSTVARLRSDEPAATGGQTGQVVRKTIPAGTYYTQAIAPGTSYGFAFEPLGTGTTTVTVTAPGAVTMTSSGVRRVQVTSPVINPGGTLTVGAGLMDSGFASLSAGQHGGVDVTISAATGPVRLSRTATEVGTQSITVHVNNGQTSIPYYVHGLENTTGSSTITLSAERFTGASHAVDVVQPGVEMHNLSGSYSNLSADDVDVYVQVGITHPTYNNAQLWQVQNVRAGSAGFEVTLTNSNVNVARLRSDEPAATGGQIGQVVKKTIPAGTYYTQAIRTGTSYGFAFEPLGNGSTNVTVTAPGTLTMTATGVRAVSVFTPALSVTETTTLGAGLMEGAFATLGASQHGGVDVTITSSAPSVVLVSPNATTTGSASTVVHVPNGQTSMPFVIHGMENVSATVVVTLSAPGFTSTTMSVTVTPSSVEILNLAATLGTAAADDTDVYVQVGITHPSYNNSQLWQVQSVRAGSPGFVVTMSVDNPARAQLRSDEPQATGQTVTKPIQPGAYHTQRLIQSGTTYGLAFDPLAAGTVVVTATGPSGTLPLDSSRRTVVINP